MRLGDGGDEGLVLSSEDIDRYHRVVVALHETVCLMPEIDEVIEKHGGCRGHYPQQTLRCRVLT